MAPPAWAIMPSLSVSLTDDLCTSFRDLEGHLDPSAQGRLGRFDAQSVREHLAAFRAIEAGVEELEVDDPADEIDRTALLDDIRVTIFRFEHERPHVRNPGFWLGHLCEALWAGGRADGQTGSGSAVRLLNSIPPFLEAAEATLRQPPAAFVDLGRALVRPAADLITGLGHGAEGNHALRVAMLAAESALARFSVLLQTDLSQTAEEHSPAAGEEEFERVLHFRYAVRAGAGEVWRYVSRLIDDLEGEVSRAGGGARTLELARDAILELEGPARSAGFPVPDALPDFVDLPDHRGVIEPMAEYVRSGRGGTARFELARNPWFDSMLTAIVAESIVPGAHTLAQHAATLRSRVRQTATVSDAGFGLYAVALLDEEGHISEREILLYRAVLAQIDIGLHTGQLNLGDSLKLLADRFPMEPLEALSAVRGVLMEPGAAAGAILTRRELLRLRDDRRRALGAGFSCQRHHEEVMGYGGLPVSLVRWGLGVDE